MSHSDSPPLGTQLDTPIEQHTNSCILYHDDRVTIIDIPTSIAEAQGNDVLPSNSSLLSCPPIASPYPNHEPKSETAREKLRAKMATEYDALYADLIDSSLAAIRKSYSGPWCLPRSHISQPSISPTGKRKADLMSANPPSSGVDDLLHQLATETPSANSHTFRWRVQDEEHATQSDPDSSTWPKYLHNPEHITRLLEITSPSSPEPSSTKFYVPPGATFYLGDCSTSHPFHMAVKSLAQQLQTARQFDVIIMDPPWPNASVKRTKKSGKSAYEVAPTIWDVRQLIFEMDIDVLLANQGIVAVWITNKPSVRDLVLGSDGLFESWGVQLQEEWLWVKTTLDGEPVSAVNALWRKPYEVLLVGRKVEQSRSDQHIGPCSTENPKVERRVIAGIPDLHSRKPCLKAMFDRCDVLNRTLTRQHRTLEVFARHLVAGWWSWGNQVLKFNNEDCWTS